MTRQLSEGGYCKAFPVGVRHVQEAYEIFIQVVSLPVHTWASLETKSQRADFIHKALQGKVVSGSEEKQPPASTTGQRKSDAETSQPGGKSNEGEPSWTSSSDRLTAERFDLGRSGGTLSNSDSLTRSVLSAQFEAGVSAILKAVEDAL